MMLQKDKEKRRAKSRHCNWELKWCRSRDRFNIGKKWFRNILYYAQSHERRYLKSLADKEMLSLNVALLEVTKETSVKDAIESIAAQLRQPE